MKIDQNTYNSYFQENCCLPAIKRVADKWNRKQITDEEFLTETEDLFLKFLGYLIRLTEGHTKPSLLQAADIINTEDQILEGFLKTLEQSVQKDGALSLHKEETEEFILRMISHADRFSEIFLETSYFSLLDRYICFLNYTWNPSIVIKIIKQLDYYMLEMDFTQFSTRKLYREVLVPGIHFMKSFVRILDLNEHNFDRSYEYIKNLQHVKENRNQFLHYLKDKDITFEIFENAYKNNVIPASLALKFYEELKIKGDYRTSPVYFAILGELFFLSHILNPTTKPMEVMPMIFLACLFEADLFDLEVEDDLKELLGKDLKQVDHQGYGIEFVRDFGRQVAAVTLTPKEELGSKRLLYEMVMSSEGLEVINFFIQLDGYRENQDEENGEAPAQQFNPELSQFFKDLFQPAQVVSELGDDQTLFEFVLKVLEKSMNHTQHLSKEAVFLEFFSKRSIYTILVGCFESILFTLSNLNEHENQIPSKIINERIMKYLIDFLKAFLADLDTSHPFFSMYPYILKKIGDIYNKRLYLSETGFHFFLADRVLEILVNYFNQSEILSGGEKISDHDVYVFNGFISSSLSFFRDLAGSEVLKGPAGEKFLKEIQVDKLMDFFESFEEKVISKKENGVNKRIAWIFERSFHEFFDTVLILKKFLSEASANLDFLNMSALEKLFRLYIKSYNADKQLWIDAHYVYQLYESQSSIQEAIRKSEFDKFIFANLFFNFETFESPYMMLDSLTVTYSRDAGLQDDGVAKMLIEPLLNNSNFTEAFSLLRLVIAPLRNSVVTVDSELQNEIPENDKTSFMNLPMNRGQLVLNRCISPIPNKIFKKSAEQYRELYQEFIADFLMAFWGSYYRLGVVTNFNFQIPTVFFKESSRKENPLLKFYIRFYERLINELSDQETKCLNETATGLSYALCVQDESNSQLFSKSQLLLARRAKQFSHWKKIIEKGDSQIIFKTHVFQDFIKTKEKELYSCLINWNSKTVESCLGLLSSSKEQQAVAEKSLKEFSAFVDLQHILYLPMSIQYANKSKPFPWDSVFLLDLVFDHYLKHREDLVNEKEKTGYLTNKLRQMLLISSLIKEASTVSTDNEKQCNFLVLSYATRKPLIEALEADFVSLTTIFYKEFASILLDAQKRWLIDNIFQHLTIIIAKMSRIFLETTGIFQVQGLVGHETLTQKYACAVSKLIITCLANIDEVVLQKCKLDSKTALKASFWQLVTTLQTEFHSITAPSIHFNFPKEAFETTMKELLEQYGGKIVRNLTSTCPFDTNQFLITQTKTFKPLIYQEALRHIAELERLSTLSEADLETLEVYTESKELNFFVNLLPHWKFIELYQLVHPDSLSDTKDWKSDLLFNMKIDLIALMKSFSKDDWLKYDSLQINEGAFLQNCFDALLWQHRKIFKKPFDLGDKEKEIIEKTYQLANNYLRAVPTVLQERIPSEFAQPARAIYCLYICGLWDCEYFMRLLKEGLLSQILRNSVLDEGSCKATLLVISYLTGDSVPTKHLMEAFLKGAVLKNPIVSELETSKILCKLYKIDPQSFSTLMHSHFGLCMPTSEPGVPVDPNIVKKSGSRYETIGEMNTFKYFETSLGQNCRFIIDETVQLLVETFESFFEEYIKAQEFSAKPQTDSPETSWQFFTSTRVPYLMSMIYKSIIVLSSVIASHPEAIPYLAQVRKTIKYFDPTTMRFDKSAKSEIDFFTLFIRCHSNFLMSSSMVMLRNITSLEGDSFVVLHEGIPALHQDYYRRIFLKTTKATLETLVTLSRFEEDFFLTTRMIYTQALVLDSILNGDIRQIKDPSELICLHEITEILLKALKYMENKIKKDEYQQMEMYLWTIRKVFERMYLFPEYNKIKDGVIKICDDFTDEQIDCDTKRAVYKLLLENKSYDQTTTTYTGEIEPALPDDSESPVKLEEQVSKAAANTTSDYIKNKRDLRVLFIRSLLRNWESSGKLIPIPFDFELPADILGTYYANESLQLWDSVNRKFTELCRDQNYTEMNVLRVMTAPGNTLNEHSLSISKVLEFAMSLNPVMINEFSSESLPKITYLEARLPTSKSLTEELEFQFGFKLPQEEILDGSEESTISEDTDTEEETDKEDSTEQADENQENQELTFDEMDIFRSLFSANFAVHLDMVIRKIDKLLEFKILRKFYENMSVSGRIGAKLRFGEDKEFNEYLHSIPKEDQMLALAFLNPEYYDLLEENFKKKAKFLRSMMIEERLLTNTDMFEMNMDQEEEYSGEGEEGEEEKENSEDNISEGNAGEKDENVIVENVEEEQKEDSPVIQKEEAQKEEEKKEGEPVGSPTDLSSPTEIQISKAPELKPRPQLSIEKPALGVYKEEIEEIKEPNENDDGESIPKKREPNTLRVEPDRVLPYSPLQRPNYPLSNRGQNSPLRSPLRSPLVRGERISKRAADLLAELKPTAHNSEDFKPMHHEGLAPSRFKQAKMSDDEDSDDGWESSGIQEEDNEIKLGVYADNNDEKPEGEKEENQFFSPVVDVGNVEEGEWESMDEEEKKGGDDDGWEEDDSDVGIRISKSKMRPKKATSKPRTRKQAPSNKRIPKHSQFGIEKEENSIYKITLPSSFDDIGLGVLGEKSQINCSTFTEINNVREPAYEIEFENERSEKLFTKKILRKLETVANIDTKAIQTYRKYLPPLSASAIEALVLFLFNEKNINFNQISSPQSSQRTMVLYFDTVSLAFTNPINEIRALDLIYHLISLNYTMEPVKEVFEGVFKAFDFKPENFVECADNFVSSLIFLLSRIAECHSKNAIQVENFADLVSEIEEKHGVLCLKKRLVDKGLLQKYSQTTLLLNLQELFKKPEMDRFKKDILSFNLKAYKLTPKKLREIKNRENTISEIFHILDLFSLVSDEELTPEWKLVYKKLCKVLDEIPLYTEFLTEAARQAKLSFASLIEDFESLVKILQAEIGSPLNNLNEFIGQVERIITNNKIIYWNRIISIVQSKSKDENSKGNNLKEEIQREMNAITLKFLDVMFNDSDVKTLYVLMIQSLDIFEKIRSKHETRLKDCTMKFKPTLNIVLHIFSLHKTREEMSKKINQHSEILASLNDFEEVKSALSIKATGSIEEAKETGISLSRSLSQIRKSGEIEIDEVIMILAQNSKKLVNLLLESNKTTPSSDQIKIFYEFPWLLDFETKTKLLK